MDMELLEGFHLVDGNLCTPQGFYMDTFEYLLDGLVGCVTILVADNPCTVAFKYPERLELNSLSNSQRLERTRGIAQAVVVGITNDTIPPHFETLTQDLAIQLNLYDEDFLLDFATVGLPHGETSFAIQFDICGVACSLGILKRGSTVYITTDVAITHSMIYTAICELYYRSNVEDTFCIVASGQAGNMVITKCNYIFNIFKKALNCVIMNLY
jgi:hypothetical protein